MGREVPYIFVYFNCDGGLNLEASPFELNENEMQKAKNGIITRKGYEKRKGYAEYSTDAITDAIATATGIDNIYKYYSANGNFVIAVAICPTDYKLCYHNGTAWTQLTGGTALTHGNHVRFEVFRKRLFIYNGAQFLYWDGTGNMADCTFYDDGVYGYLSSVTPKLLAVADNRIFAVDADDDETVLYTDANAWVSPSDIAAINIAHATIGAVLNLAHTGVGTVAKVTVSDTVLTTIVTGGGGGTKTYTLSGYADIDALATDINLNTATEGITATALVGDSLTGNLTILAPTSIYNANLDLNSDTTDMMRFGIYGDLPLPERTNNLNGIVSPINYSLNDELLALRENDIWALMGVGPTDYQWVKLDEGGGCVAAEGVVAVPEVARPNEPTRESYLLSVGNGKVFMIQGGACDGVSAPVRKRLVNKGLSGAVAVYDGLNEVVLISVGGTTLVWDCSKLVWCSEWDINFDCACRLTAHSDFNVVLFGWRDSVYVWQLNSGTSDNGDSIPFWMQSRAFTFLETAETKEVRSAQVLVETNEDTPCTMTIYMDETISGANDVDVKRVTGGNTKWGTKKWGTFKWGGRKKRMATVHLPTGLKGNSFSYKIKSNDTNDLTIYQVGIEVGLESLRRKYN